jgi:hypothetical protein
VGNAGNLFFAVEKDRFLAAGDFPDLSTYQLIGNFEPRMVSINLNMLKSDNRYFLLPLVIRNDLKMHKPFLSEQMQTLILQSNIF